MKHLAWLLVPLALAGCRTRDVEILSRIFHRIGEKFQSALRRPEIPSASTLLPGLAPENMMGRVRCRLQWDRVLEGVKIEIDSPKEGVIRLRGSLASKQQQERVLELVQSTVGVQSVQDELQVPEKK